MITESIYDNGKVLVPMADVNHVEYQIHPTMGKNGILVIMKNTHYDMIADTWSNALFICEGDKEDFISAYCRFRSELESIFKA